MRSNIALRNERPELIILAFLYGYKGLATYPMNETYHHSLIKPTLNIPRNSHMDCSQSREINRYVIGLKPDTCHTSEKMQRVRQESGTPNCQWVAGRTEGTINRIPWVLHYPRKPEQPLLLHRKGDNIKTLFNTGIGMHINEFIGLLKNVYKRGNNKWRCTCPSHGSSKDAMMFSLAGDGYIVTHCFAGCTQDEILQAMGLEKRHLFTIEGTDYDKADYKIRLIDDKLEHERWITLIFENRTFEATVADHRRYLKAKKRIRIGESEICKLRKH